MIGAIAASAILWPLYLLFVLPLWLLGWPVCYCLSRRAAWIYRQSRYFDRFVHAWRPGWINLVYGNEEDGVTGPDWWREQHADWSIEKRAFIWSAWRNPTNNLRFLPVVNPIIDPARIRSVGNSDDPSAKGDEDRERIEWSFTWQGVYAGLVWRWQITATHHASARIGWKLLPRDRHGVPEWDYRRIRCPFGFQLHAWRRS